MSGRIVPDDYTPPGQIYYIFSGPDSPKWQALLRGALLELGQSWQWDYSTGDVDNALVVSFESYLTFYSDELGNLLCFNGSTATSVGFYLLNGGSAFFAGQFGYDGGSA